MNKLLEHLWDYVAHDETLSMQRRLYRLICLVSALLCIVVILPINLLQNLPPFINVAVSVFGLFSIYLYRDSLRRREHVIVFFAALVLLLDSTWFPNGGSTGSIIYYFAPAIIYPMILCRGRVRWIMVALLVVDVCALLVTEFHFPSLVVHFHSQSDRMLDLMTGVFCSALASALMLWVVIANYDWEHGLISRYSKDLAASEKNYREVVENANTVILRMDRHGSITFFNKFAETLFGYRREEIIGKQAVDTIVPRTASAGADIAGMVEGIVKDPGRYAHFESQNVCSDTRRIWVSWTNQPIYENKGELTEILCVGSDITERKAILEQLSLTQRTMDAAAEEIIWTDDHARIIYTNAAATEMLGYTVEEFRNLTLHDIMVDFSPLAWSAQWERLKQNRSLTIEAVQRRKDGTSIPVESSMTYLYLEGKEYTSAFIRDITERKRTEEKRLHLEQQMLHVQKLESLGLLAGGIAHDFNNILTAILGNIALVRMELKPETGEYRQLGEAEKASMHARDLTMQLLTFSKGGMPIKSTIPLDQVIRDSVNFALRGSRVKSTIDLAPGLWSVDADAAQLGQVFNNLIINAYQAMPDGGLVAIAATNNLVGPADGLLVKEGRYVKVSVRDQGTGIMEGHLDKIFDPYFTTKQTGSGLGLAVTYSIIKNHHGHISVQSTQGEGSCFTVLLPASERQSVKQPLTEDLAVTCSGRVLIMDDEEMVRDVAGAIVKRFGYSVEYAVDGEEAVKLYQQASASSRPFDVVVMDLTIRGGMGGKEALRKLRELDPRVKAIASSGYSQDPVMANFREFGFCGVIAKPYRPKELGTILQSVLSS